MSAYYNEFDPKTAAWLRELIKQKLIADGEVDERSITDVRPGDLRGFTQCHFFAGIGGWSLALRLAGWGDERPVWTGSCPCQPFSSAGKGLAQADHRHLWPVFANLIAECRPNVVFGEQVASAIGKGWLDGVRADMEREGYAVGAAVLGAHSVGAPHIRQRLYWVADTCQPRVRDQGRGQDAGQERRDKEQGLQREWFRNDAGDDSASGGRLADSTDNGHAPGYGLRAQVESSQPAGEDGEREPAGGGDAGGVDHAAMPRYQSARKRTELREQWSGERLPRQRCAVGGMADNNNTGSQGWDGAELRERTGQLAAGKSDSCGWDSYRVILCRDGKLRRIPAEPAFFPLAHGIPERVVRLRGYGNAIVPQVAAEFIQAWKEVSQ